LDNERILSKIELEVWQSSHNRHERHYFIRDGKLHGYQADGLYLFGLNPEVVTPEQEQEILKILGYGED
jgi:hypothetical protein